jgi:hypothetical protein
MEVYFYLRRTRSLPKNVVDHIFSYVFTKVETEIFKGGVSILGHSFWVPKKIKKERRLVIRVDDEPILIKTLQNVSSLSGIFWPSGLTFNQILRLWMRKYQTH